MSALVARLRQIPRANNLACIGGLEKSKDQWVVNQFFVYATTLEG